MCAVSQNPIPHSQSHLQVTGERKKEGEPSKEQQCIESAISLWGKGNGREIRALLDQEFLLTFPFLFVFRQR